LYRARLRATVAEMPTRARSVLIAATAGVACHAPPPPVPPAVAAAPAPRAARAATPAPPPTVIPLAVISASRHAGEGELRLEADGGWTSHYAFNDRGRGPDIRTTFTLDAAGRPRTLTSTGYDYLKAPVDEHLDVVGDHLVWRSTSERGEAPADAGFYVPLSDQFAAPLALARALLRAPDHRLALLPQGEAWLEDDTPRELAVAGATVRVHRVAIAGLGFQPTLVWLDDHDAPYAAVAPWMSVIRAGHEAAIEHLLADDQAWTAARAARLAGSLAHRPPAAGLAITHARVFDSVHKTVVADATVIVTGDKITKLGDARTKIPDGAQVIDAHGKTLLPGLWDMHVHLNDSDGLLDLATGVTTVRDLGNDMTDLLARIGRFDAGTEIGPHVLRAGLIDGPGPFTAPTGALAETPAQAIAAVDQFAAAGYQQIKIYSSVPPALVPVIARAAHAHHLRVSGHIPTGMNAAEAVEAGYDEIQHVNFLFLRFFAGPDDDTRTPLRFTMVAERGADLDLAGADVQKLLDLFVAHRTVLDPTLATFHDMFSADPGELDPILAPYAAQLPAQVVRGGRNGGLPATARQRATYRASYAALLKLVKRAWDKKIRIVAGTDDAPGLTLAHELELYVQAGIPAPDVLALATIGAARVMGLDREAGSIAAGKRADLVLVDGDPTRDIAAVRNTLAVVCRGVVYDPAELRAASGMRRAGT
jgi:imidazolonepropionase-like amidohydrolase